jgi:phosphoribosyl-AMP cyclohydrolase
MWTASTPFAAPGDKLALEEGAAFTPKFDAHGLVTVVTVDDADGAVLMVAHMNAEALGRTLETGQAWYWSRSRGRLWRKGESSGHGQQVVSILTDCDQDALVMRVRQSGPACHTLRRSCFYRRVSMGSDGPVLVLERTDAAGE